MALVLGLLQPPFGKVINFGCFISCLVITATRFFIQRRCEKFHLTLSFSKVGQIRNCNLVWPTKLSTFSLVNCLLQLQCDQMDICVDRFSGKMLDLQLLNSGVRSLRGTLLIKDYVHECNTLYFIQNMSDSWMKLWQDEMQGGFSTTGWSV